MSYMPKRVTYHVVSDDDVWKVKRQGSDRSSGNFERKKEAIDRAKELAKNQDLGQVKIHKQDGKIQTEYTYGEDPRKYMG